MLNKGSKLYSIVQMKCPRCHEGNLFNSPLYKGKLYDMPDRCPVCRQSFMLEPGFYWGAMYVAYAFSSGALIIVALLSLLVFHLTLTVTIIAMLITAVIGFIFNARLSRSTWINIFVRYDPHAAQNSIG